MPGPAVTKNKKDTIIEWLANSTTLEAITNDDFGACEPGLLVEFKSLNGKEATWESFFRYALNLKLDPRTDERLKHLRSRWSLWKSSQDHKASHQARRRMVHMLGINNSSYTVVDAVRQGKSAITMPCGTTMKLVRRGLNTTPLFPIRHHMFDLSNTGEGLGHCYNPETVDETNGFYIVHPDESVLFYSGAPEDFTKDAIEMIVIRGVALSSDSATKLGSSNKPDGGLSSQPSSTSKAETSDGEMFYDWLKTVIEFACQVQKNQCEKDPRTQRYGHDGHMAQFGLTLGARSKRPATGAMIGWGVSYTLKLAHEAHVAHDQDVIAAAAVFWSLIMSMMPSEVTKPILKTLQESHIPQMASRYIEEGQGFTLTLNGKEYHFPNANRGPPELYLTRGYSAWSHTDECYTRFAFNLSAGREQVDTATSGKVHIPSYGGANFVDVSLHVVIINKVATMFAFNPKHVHGTTVTGGTINYHLTYAFSLQIEEALKRLEGGNFYGAQSWGAGQENLDHTNSEFPDDN